MMKILMLGWELPPHNSGGLGVACYNLCKSLGKSGADIDFVVPYTALHDQIDFMNIISALPLDPLHRFGGGAYDSEMIDQKLIPHPVTHQLHSIRDVQRAYCDFIVNYLAEHHPDVVHAHDWLTFEAGLIAKRQYGVPFIAHVHATEYDRSGMHGGNPLIHEIEQEALTVADRIFAVSETTKHLIHDKYNIPLDKIDVAYNSLDENFINDNYNLNQADYRQLEALKRRGYTIVSTVGRFTVQKGLWHMMHAAARAIRKNPKLIFIFAGDGEERNQLIELSAKLGIARNVIFTGFVRGHQLRDIYEITDIFVMSSISEPFGLTALEAAHHGDILILTKQSGVSEVLRSALRYDFWDEEKLANEILAVASSSSLRSTLKRGIKREYLHISWDDIAKKCLAVYTEFDRKHGGHK